MAGQIVRNFRLRIKAACESGNHQSPECTNLQAPMSKCRAPNEGQVVIRG